MSRAQRVRWAIVQLLRNFLPRRHRPVINIFMDSKGKNRRILLVQSLFKYAGYNVNFTKGWDLFKYLNKYGYKAISSEDSRWQPWRNKDRELTVVFKSEEYSKIQSPKKILVSYDFDKVPLTLKPNQFYLPILVHPNLLGFITPDRLTPESGRKMLAFFAGNMDPEMYDQPHFRTKFGIDNRVEILNCLMEKEFSQAAEKPASLAEFMDHLNRGLYADKIVLVDTKKFQIPQVSWLSILGQCRYFIAPPGYSQPFCHNIVEAMSMGCVPITGYGHYFRPPLSSGKNALLFGNLEELRVLVRDVVNQKGSDSWTLLSEAAFNYQKEHLSLESFKKAFDRFVDDHSLNTLEFITSGSGN